MIFIFISVAKKLFTTFSTPDKLENTISNIVKSYSILHQKIFVLSLEGEKELICTYNVDPNNLSGTKIIDNTILLHRNKETNTLYSIDALNALVMSLNNGYLDRNFKINWLEYKNSLILTRRGELCKIPTKIFSVIFL